MPESHRLSHEWFWKTYQPDLTSNPIGNAIESQFPFEHFLAVCFQVIKEAFSGIKSDARAAFTAHPGSFRLALRAGSDAPDCAMRRPSP
jgi:hypothetical protein